MAESRRFLTDCVFIKGISKFVKRKINLFVFEKSTFSFRVNNSISHSKKDIRLYVINYLCILVLWRIIVDVYFGIVYIFFLLPACFNACF